jgi:hypothetical protein
MQSRCDSFFFSPGCTKKLTSGWKTTLLTSVFLYGHPYFLPHCTMVRALIQMLRMLIRMFVDVRWVGFLPPNFYGRNYCQLVCSLLLATYTLVSYSLFLGSFSWCPAVFRFEPLFLVKFFINCTKVLYDNDLDQFLIFASMPTSLLSFKLKLLRTLYF